MKFNLKYIYKDFFSPLYIYNNDDIYKKGVHKKDAKKKKKHSRKNMLKHLKHFNCNTKKTISRKKQIY